ncbi:MAG TPA: site-specific integrase [Bryobacteraceae bacterium]|jgi:integrase|nr:site-specific integrase [Bryobacteraceae bacterium]
MSAAAVIPFQRESSTALQIFVESVTRYARASRAESTLRGYRSDWSDFEHWSLRHRLQPLPAAPATLAAYISACADFGKLKAGSIQRRASAIAAMHTAAGFDSPTSSPEARLTLAGIRRTLGVAQAGKAPILTADVAAMVAHLPDKLLGVRDRALLLIGFAGAFRRSELVALDIEDIEFREDGLKVTIRKSKTDQEGAGQVIGIAFGSKLCPVRALQEWLAAAQVSAGPIFRRIDRHGRLLDWMSPGAVAIVVKRYAAAAGLDPAKYAGHSLRAGLVTQAAMNGVPELAIMRQTRHKSSDMLRKYIRDASLFRENASARVGL